MRNYAVLVNVTLFVSSTDMREHIYGILNNIGCVQVKWTSVQCDGRAWKNLVSFRIMWS